MKFLWWRKKEDRDGALIDFLITLSGRLEIKAHDQYKEIVAQKIKIAAQAYQIGKMYTHIDELGGLYSEDTYKVASEKSSGGVISE